MANPVTNVRLDPELKRAAVKRAQDYCLTFTDIVKILVRAFVNGEIDFGIMHPASKYPHGYLEILEREVEENDRLYEEGTVQAFDDAKDAMKALRKECNDLSNAA